MRTGPLKRLGLLWIPIGTIAAVVAAAVSIITLTGGDGQPTISSVTISGDLANPVITLSGKNFGFRPTVRHRPRSGNTGWNYESGKDTLRFTTDRWSAGSWDLNDNIGLNVLKYTGTEITFTFGNAYAAGGTSWKLRAGETFAVYVKSDSCGGRVAAQPITSVACRT